MHALFASGYILLGKRLRGSQGAGSAEDGSGDKSKTLQLAVSAFRIPFGHCLYTPPRTWHCDAGLHGRWIVGYTQAPVFETLVLRRPASGVRIGEVPAAQGESPVEGDRFDLLQVRIGTPTTGTGKRQR